MFQIGDYVESNQKGTERCDLNTGKAVPVLLILVLACVSSVSAQNPTGAISGTVVDQTGLAVAGADVTLVSLDTNRETKTKTNDKGAFDFVALAAGYYRIDIKMAGFRQASVPSVKVDVGLQASLPPTKLEVGPVESTVVVEGSATNIQTANAQISDTVTRQQIQNLPLINRNPLALLGLQAGVAQNGRSVTVINGQRASLSNVTLDGVNIQDNFIRSNSLDFLPNLPLISQVSEFSVSTSNTGPDAGLGASQVTIETPRGTNDVHAEAFWYHRSNTMAASSWFANAAGRNPTTGLPVTPKPFLLLNQLGGNIGAPVIKNKLFLYGYYELFRNRAQTLQNHTILTDAARQGIYTYRVTCTTTCPAGTTAGQVRTLDLLAARGTLGPFTINPYVGGLLQDLPAQSAINNFSVGDSTSAQLFNTAGNQFNKKNNRTRDNWGIRGDYNINDRQSISATWSWNRDIIDRNDLDGSFTTAPLVTNSDYAYLFSASWRWTPTNAITNEFRLGSNMAPVVFLNDRDFASDTLYGNFLFTNTLVNFRDQGRDTNTYNWQDNLTWSKGNHLLRFGGSSQFIRATPFNEAAINPTYNVGFGTGNPNAFVAANFPGGISTADLARANNLFVSLTGFVNTGNRRFNVTDRTTGYAPGAPARSRLRFNTHAAYVNDTWRLWPNLTMTVGMRYEYVGRFHERDGLFLLPVIQAGQTAQDTVLSANPVLDFAGGRSGRPIYEGDYNNLAPNIGFAWDPWKDGKTSLRFGYSINFVNDEGIRSADNAAGANAGLNTTVTLPNSSAFANAMIGGTLPPINQPAFLVPRTLQDNFNLANAPATIFTVTPDLRAPYVQQWNFGIQREFGWGITLEVRYVGNHGTGLYRGVDYNQVDILSNGFLNDFFRARSNGFIALAATGTFNPAFNAALAGSQPLTVITTAASGGNLANSTVRNNIQTGQPGELANFYHSNNLCGALCGVITPSRLAFPADVMTNGSHSVFHSGIVEVKRRFSKGLALQASYVYGKVLTDVTNPGQTRFDPYLDNARPGVERARAVFDIPHAFKANFVYDLPFGRGRAFAPGNPIVNGLISGWNVSSVFTWQTGNPFSILSGRGTFNRAGRSGNNTANSNLTAEQLKHFVGLFFTATGPYVINPALITTTGLGVGNDTAAPCNYTSFTGQVFCHPEAGQLGTLQRMAFNGPTFFAWDAGIIKTTNITERLKIRYRAEFFNFLNHPVFGTGDETIGATTFGRIASGDVVVAARRIQMGLQLLW